MTKPILKEYLSGQTVFKENSPGNTAFIIKEGEIELSVERGQKKTVLQKLKKGSCFGEMAIITKSKRSATAVAIKPTILYIFDEAFLNEELSKAGILGQGIIRTLIKSVIFLSEKAAKDTSIVDPKISIAHILKMQAESLAHLRTILVTDSLEIDLPYLKVIKLISDIIGMPTSQVTNELKQMSDLGLIKVQIKQQSLIVAPLKLVSHTRSICHLLAESSDKAGKAELSFVSADDIANIVNIDKNVLYQKIAQKGIPDSMFYFRKDELIHYIEAQGSDFFA